MHDFPSVALADAAVAAVALSLASWEAFMAWARPRGREHLWRALVAAASGIYAVLVGLHYTVTDPAQAILLTKLEAVAILTVFLSTPPLVASMIGRRLPGLLLGLVIAPALVSGLLLPTDLLISHEVEVRHFSLVDRPFLRMVETPLLWVAMGVAFLAVVGSAAWLWRHRELRPRATHHLLVGMAVWLGFLVAEEGLRLLGLPIPLNLFEYGFLGFALALVTHDVRRHLELLDGAEQALEQLIGATSDAIVAVDAEATVVAVNATLETTLGLAPDHRLEGYALSEIVDDRDHALLGELLAGRHGVAEIRLIRPDSRVVPVEAAMLQAGRSNLRILLFRDISARARATAQRLHEGRAAAFESVSAAVDHHLRDALERVAQLQEPGLEAVVSDMAAVVDALALFSSGDEDPRPVQLDRIIGAAAALAAELIEPRARMKLDVPPGTWCRGTEPGLAGIVLDLLQYAASQIAPGSPADHEIALEVLEDSDLVEISVRHTGPAVADEAGRRSLFAEFPEARDGLVLGVCRDAVRRMGGRLVLQGDGRTLTVTLPRAPAAAQSPSPPAPR